MFKLFFYQAILGLSVIVVLVGCSNAPRESSTVQTAMSDIVAEQKTLKQDVPKAVSDALLPGAYSPPPSRVSETRFDVSVNQVPARTFFVSLVADAGVNVVAHQEVAGLISLELRNVTVDEVLNITRDVYGYEYKVNNGIYTIYPRKLRTEIFAIDYLDVQRVGVTDTNVQIGKITSNSSGNGGSGGSGGGRGGNRGNSSSSGGQDSANLFDYIDEGDGGSQSGSGITPGARVQTLSKTNFWHGLNQTIQAIIGDEVGRMVMTNPQAGLVVVKALPGELRSVKNFLEKSELSVKRQVVLETKILEVRLNDGFEAGINWGAISGSLAMSQTNTSAGSLGDILIDGNSQQESIVSTVLNITDITKLLFLLEQQGNVQVLSSPRISTVNNQKAVIRVGSDEFFVTGISNSTTTGGNAVVNTPEVELDSFFSGIALDVTPQISDDGGVILHVHPMVTNVSDQIKQIDIAGESFSLPLALREVRESDSIVKAQSGQVVVLGGLMQETTANVDTKRAFLGNIPVLNLLFKAKQASKQKTELVILMKPLVIGENSWQQQLREQEERIKQLTGQP